MDHNNVGINIKQEETSASDFNAYVTEEGKHYRVPYKLIKKVTFTDLKKSEMVDIPHAARLQYRLMLLDPVIKATVDFTKSKITVLYNPREAENMKEKMSMDELVDFLAKQGIGVDTNKMQIEDYDYYKRLYSYAYNPDKVRESAPYGYTLDEWQKTRPEWEEKNKTAELKKREKFSAMQQQYLEENPEVAARIEPGFKKSEAKNTFFGKLFGKNKKLEKGKGFWFHGM